MEIDIGVEEDENINTSNIISKYTFISNDNCKNLIFNSMTFRKIDILSPFKRSANKGKGISRNIEFNGLNNSTRIILNTQRTDKIFLLNK